MNQHSKLITISNHMGIMVWPGTEFGFHQAWVGETCVQKFITFDQSAGPRIWEWSMLHEIGHAELFERRERTHVKSLERSLKRTYRGYKPTEAFYRDYLAMEWKAWEQGFRIAQREGVHVNTKQYFTFAEKCWRTYVRELSVILK